MRFLLRVVSTAVLAGLFLASALLPSFPCGLTCAAYIATDKLNLEPKQLKRGNIK